MHKPYPVKDLLSSNRRYKGLFVILIAWSIAAHSIGAFLNVGSWNADVEVDRFPHRLWSWTDNQLVDPPRRLLGRAVIALRRLPTSRTSPELLAASYDTSLPPTVDAVASEPIRVSVKATNTGHAVWLATVHEDKGSVRLGWRWLKGTQVLTEGRVPLRFDIFPEQSHDFSATISPPGEPGIYVLEVGLVSEFVAWFSDLGTRPIRFTVEIRPH